MPISITLIIIAITVLVSSQAFNNQTLMHKLAFVPYDVKHHKRFEKLLSYMLVHADWSHLLFNMISFYIFGDLMNTELRATFGEAGLAHFLILYVVGGVFSTIWPMIRNQDEPNYIALGASGAVSSIIFAAMLWNPTMQMGLIFIPGIMIPAYVFAPLYLAFEFWAFKRNKTNIAHDAHIGGAIFGILYVLMIYPEKGKIFLIQIFG